VVLGSAPAFVMYSRLNGAGFGLAESQSLSGSHPEWRSSYCYNFEATTSFLGPVNPNR